MEIDIAKSRAIKIWSIVRISVKTSNTLKHENDPLKLLKINNKKTLILSGAFIGYVLPWGQISYWEATVIINLLSAIPYIGDTIVLWIWGGFSIKNATLNRFFSLHFILPLVILFIVIILHLFALHLTGSSNPLGSNFNNYKISFHPYFSIKDLLGFYIILFIFIFINFQFPYHLGDPDNFKIANAINTPTLQYIFLVNIKLTSLC